MRTGLSVAGATMAVGHLTVAEDNASTSEPIGIKGRDDGSRPEIGIGSERAQTTSSILSGVERHLDVAPGAMPVQWGPAADVASHTRTTVDAGVPCHGVAPGFGSPATPNWQSALFAGLDSAGMNPSLAAALGMFGGDAHKSAKDELTSQLNGELGALGFGDAGMGLGSGNASRSGAAPDVNLGMRDMSLYGADTGDGGTAGGLNGSGTVGPQDSRVTALENAYDACKGANASVGPFDVGCKDGVAGVFKGLFAPLSNPSRSDPGAPKDPATAHNEAVDQENKQNGTGSSNNNSANEQKITDAIKESQDKGWKQAKDDKAANAEQDKKSEDEALKKAENDPPSGQGTAMVDPDAATVCVTLPTPEQIAIRLGEVKHTINPDDGTDPSGPVDVSSLPSRPGEIDPTIALIDNELGASMTGSYGTPRIETAPIDKVQGWNEQNAPRGAPGQGGTTPDNAQTMPH